jgi:nicotinate-nucleotide pyrophosphorylase (carboxylating)
MNYFSNLEATVANALAEDVGTADLTALLIDVDRTASARIITREDAIFCGRPWADEVLRQVDHDIEISWNVAEGESASADSLVATLTGPARGLLTAERCVLNFLQILSGTATRTRRYVDAIKGTGATLLDTRKTIPGLRLAQKYAVKTGGAENHRIGLFDAFLIKENHIEASGSISEAILRARKINSKVRVEVEVETFEQLEEAIEARPDWIMLDNFTTDAMVLAVKRTAETGIKLEASGGIENLKELEKIAFTGVDYISVGALTKHCEAIDLSMRFE